MKTITASAARKLGKFLANDFREIFGSTQDELAERLGSLARITIECVGRSDALYHNYEHTWLVTMAGRDILQGLIMSRRIEPSDYVHLIVACLLHDIGYVRGILSGDTGDEFVVSDSGDTIRLPRGASDASLTLYHVDRSKLFAIERLGKSPGIDAERIARAIEYTRFPPPPERRTEETDDILPRLVQAADLIGQLGDPMYAKKVNALFYEFALSTHRHVRRLLVLLYKLENAAKSILEVQLEINMSEHREIIDAIRRSDRVALSTLLPAHAKQAQTRLLNVMNGNSVPPLSIKRPAIESLINAK